MFTFEVKSEVVKALCNTRMTKPGRDDRNLSLCGMMAKKTGGFVTLCTTDRYVISRYELPGAWASTGDNGLGIVPQDLVDIMARGKRGLFYEVKVDSTADTSRVTITELPFIRTGDVHTYESTYTGYHTDFTRVMNQGKRLDEDACIFTPQMMKVLKVGKELFGPDTWCEIGQYEDGVYVVAHNPKDRADFVTHKLAPVLDSVRR